MSDSTWGDSVNLQLGLQEALLFEFQDFGFQVHQNIKDKKDHLDKTKQGFLLKNAFAGTPAMIVGAGPSVAVLQDLMGQAQNKALIFAGGTALSELAKWQVQPHFAAAVDPAAEKTALKWSFDCPTFFQGRSSNALFNSARGSWIQMPSSGVHPFENYLHSMLSDATATNLDSGWTVSTYLAAVAAYLGCNPIIFVGMDLCYSSGKKYSSLKTGAIPQDQLISLKDIDGKIVLTQRDWILAADWLEAFIAKRPDCTHINTALEGKKLRGAQVKTLENVLASLPDLPFDVREKVQTTIDALPCFATEKSASVWDKAKQSVQDAQKIIQQMLKVIETHFPAPVWQKGEFILLESDLYDTFAYEMFLEPAWNAWVKSLETMYKKEADPHFAKRIHQLLFFQNILDNHPYGK